MVLWEAKLIKTVFRREVGKNFIIVQIYVDDISFRATNEPFYARIFLTW